jgi:hypothetical protein
MAGWPCWDTLWSQPGPCLQLLEGVASILSAAHNRRLVKHQVASQVLFRFVGSSGDGLPTRLLLPESCTFALARLCGYLIRLVACQARNGIVGAARDYE